MHEDENTAPSEPPADTPLPDTVAAESAAASSADTTSDAATNASVEDVISRLRRKPVVPDSQREETPRHQFYLNLAIGVFAAALLVFAAVSVLTATRAAHARRIEAETNLASTTAYAARALEARLAALIQRVRASAAPPLTPAQTPEDTRSLRRLATTPDPLVASVTTIEGQNAPVITARIESRGADAGLTLVFPAQTDGAPGPLLAAKLQQDWLTSALEGGRSTDAVAFVAVAPDGRVAATSGAQPVVDALGLRGRVPITLLGEASLSPEGIASWRALGGDRLIVSATTLQQGITLAGAARLAPAIIAWDKRLGPFALLASVPLVLGLTLVFVIWRQSRALRQSEHQRESSERVLNLAVTSTGCGLWDWDIPGGRIFWSGPLLALTGRPSRGTWLSLDESYQLLLPADVPKLERFREQITHGITTVDAVLRLQSLQGRTIWCQARLRPWQDGGERIVGMFLDATAAVEARVAAESLAQRLQDALDASTDAIAIYSHGKVLERCNAAFDRLLASYELAGTRPTLERVLVPLLASGYTVGGTLDLKPTATDVGTFELFNSGGRWLRLTVQKFKGDGVLLQIADLSGLEGARQPSGEGNDRLRDAIAESEKSRLELVELAQKYAAEKTRVDEANRTKSEFLANMSHELKTPLNAIIGFSEIMNNELYGSLGDERYRGYAADIYDSGRQLLNLIDDILEMAKIEAGKVELNVEDLDLTGLVGECVRLMEPRARDAGVSLDNLVTDTPEAYGDRRATKRILMNLLTNAVKFTPRGGRITLQAQASRRVATISVADTGIGIAEDDLERIVKPFEQVEQHQSRSHRGTGLGLAISKALSEMQGGALAITSTQGVGTTVSVELPRERVDTAFQRAG